MINALCKTGPGPIWMAWSGFGQRHLVRQQAVRKNGQARGLAEKALRLYGCTARTHWYRPSIGPIYPYKIKEIYKKEWKEIIKIKYV